MRRSFLTSHPRATRLLAACVVAVALGIATPLYLYKGAQANVTAKEQTIPDATNQPVTGALERGTPEYDTVLPEGTSIQDYGGWTRVSPPNRDPVFAYVDSIGEIPINVSQQPLPKEFSDQPDEQIGVLAQGYLATKKLDVGGTTVYLGTSGKGPQSVIFTKNKLLILIKASAGIPDEQWQKYIQSLG